MYFSVILTFSYLAPHILIHPIKHNTYISTNSVYTVILLAITTDAYLFFLHLIYIYTYFVNAGIFLSVFLFFFKKCIYTTPTSFVIVFFIKLPVLAAAPDIQ